MQTTLRKMGNSRGLILPKPLLAQLGVAPDARFDLRVENGAVIAEPVKRTVREGWEEDAKRIGAEPLTQEELDWLGCPNEFDGTEWTW